MRIIKVVRISSWMLLLSVIAYTILLLIEAFFGIDGTTAFIQIKQALSYILLGSTSALVASVVLMAWSKMTQKVKSSG